MEWPERPVFNVKVQIEHVVVVVAAVLAFAWACCYDYMSRLDGFTVVTFGHPLQLFIRHKH